MEDSPPTSRPARSPVHPKKYKEHVRTIGAELRDMNEPIRRLIIQKVVLNNFKSYGGETTIGPFHKRFTSIVGPNGSGKSNVIDAMLFVFGFRAKQIRFDKLSELIHNSKYYMTKNNGKPLQSMKVEIHFVEILDRDPDSDDYEVIEGSELVISREVNSDNTSKYRLNGTVCTQKQISNALKSYGMDLYNNRFLILQGEVEQISQMKPKATKPEEEGLLEYLEDIIGTNQYLEQINQAFEKYEELQEQYQQFYNRTMVTQNEIQEIYPGLQEADAYLAKEKLLHKYSYLLAKRELGSTQEEIDKADAELAGIRDELRTHNEAMAAVTDQKNELTKKLKKLEAEMQKLSAKQREHGEEFKKLCNRDEDLRMQLLHEVKKVEEKTKTIKTLSTKIPELEREAKQKLEDSELMKQSIPVLTQELEAAERELEGVKKALSAETEKLMQELQVHEKELAPVQERYDAAKNELEAIETNLQLIDQSVEEDQKRKTSLEAEYSSTQVTTQANRDSLNAMNARAEECAKKAERIARDIAQVEAMIAEANSQLINTRVSYESMRNEVGQNKFHSSIHEFVKKLERNDPNIHGQFGDLVRVDEGFEKAFMAICGHLMEVFVVETPEVATKIFSQLRQNNLGKVTCVAVSVLAQNEREQAAEWGQHGYLSRYVHPSDADKADRVAKCISHYTRDVIVVADLDEADEVARKSNKRVVTLEGEVIERDGRITGGGLSQRLNKYKQAKKQDKQDINAVYKKIEEHERSLKELRETHSRLDIERDQNDLQIRELKFTLDATRRKLRADEDYLRELESSLDALNQTLRAQTGKDELNQLKKKLEETQRRKDDVYAELVKKKLRVDQCLQQVDNVGGGALAGAKQRAAECEGRLAQLRRDIDGSREQYASLAGESQKYARDLTRLESDIQQHKTREKNLEKQLDELEEEASKINEALMQVNNELNALKSGHAELSEGLRAIAGQIKEHDVLVIDLRHTQEKCEKALAGLRGALRQKTDRMAEAKKAFNAASKLLRKSTRAHELYKATTRLDSLSIAAEALEPLAEAAPEAEMDVDRAPGENSAEPSQTDLDSVAPASSAECESGEEAAQKAADQPEDDIDEGDEEPAHLGRRIQALRNELANVPNLSVIDSFAEKADEFHKKKHTLLGLQKQRDDAKLLHEELSFKRKSEFLLNFEIIANKLKEIYQVGAAHAQMITLGGDAELELVDATEPFTEGVLFSVRPVKKSWKQIYNLSGGEKTLSSLALVFALHHYKPNPVYFMDEIDAALDFRNVSIIAQSIKERTKDAQFIIISLRNQMFEMCNKMVGIYKTFDITKSVSINPLTLKNREDRNRT